MSAGASHVSSASLHNTQASSSVEVRPVTQKSHGDLLRNTKVSQDNGHLREKLQTCWSLMHISVTQPVLVELQAQPMLDPEHENE